MAIRFFHLFTFVLFFGAGRVFGTLSSTFYTSSCPNLTTIVSDKVQQVVANEPRMCASLIRLFFHDCFVQGCDASILLDGSSLEQNAFPNANSVRGYDVVDDIKTAVEAQCPGVVSCADLLALIARDCVLELSGPSWTVYFGRRDSLTASQSLANSDLPPPTANVSALATAFQNKGLSLQDLVALSGAHTVGQAQCSSFKQRLYGPTFQTPDCMDSAFNSSLQSACPSSGGDTNLSPLDLQTPVTFDNKYFINLLHCKGLLFSDETLASNATTWSMVHNYAVSQSTFFQDFGAAMINMGNINPITSGGEIRLHCGQVN